MQNEYEQLLSTEIGMLTNEQREFKALHMSIVANGNAAAVYVVEMARGLKEMRDTAKYKAAGFKDFGEYTESACGIKERQAYNYITIVEKLSQDFLQSNAKLGITKLSLLASMSESEREEIIDSHAEKLDTISVKELEKIKEGFKNNKIIEINTISHDDSDFEEKVRLSADLKAAEEEKAKLSAELERIKIRTNELKAMEDEIRKLKAEKKTAEIAIADTHALKEKEIAAALEKERAEAKNAEEKLEIERRRLELEVKKSKISADPVVTEFKARFTLFQEIGNALFDLLPQMEPDNAIKCRDALTAVMGRWQIH